MIQVLDWSKEVVLGARAWVLFKITRGDGTDRTPLRPVRILTLDARVDGLPGKTVVGEDLRWVTGLSLTMERTGTFSLHVTAVDDQGCADETGAFRGITVVSR